MTVSEEMVRAAIDKVVDPCSRFNRTNMSLTQLGMVHSVRVEGQKVTIKLLLDSPICDYLYEIDRGIQEAVGALPGVEHVVVDLVHDIVWTEERMPLAGRAKLASARLKAARAHVRSKEGYS